ncbi:zinc-finger double domain-containing protein [Ditylenchus destructor]|nr:zinc-finger double domain-containing protein [Ditylenchus destructor]
MSLDNAQHNTSAQNARNRQSPDDEEVTIDVVSTQDDEDPMDTETPQNTVLSKTAFLEILKARNTEPNTSGDSTPTATNAPSSLAPFSSIPQPPSFISQALRTNQSVMPNITPVAGCDSPGPKSRNINNLNLNLFPNPVPTFSFPTKTDNAEQSGRLSLYGRAPLIQAQQMDTSADTPTPPAITTTTFGSAQSENNVDPSKKDPVPNINAAMLKTPPLICEQGPSAPSSPVTSPAQSPGGKKRPSPLSVDALQRFDLLSPNYVPNTMDYSKLSPTSPGYTSDLGSSPRSSICLSHRDSLVIGNQISLGIPGQTLLNAANWAVFRDFAGVQAKHLARAHSSHSDYDDTEDSAAAKDYSYLSPSRQAISPAPFSPFSDCLDSSTETPYSIRSPNLSPLPSSMHFSFEQIQRSRSSMSNANHGGNESIGGLGGVSPSSRRSYKHHLYHKNSNRHQRNRDGGHSPLPQKRLNQQARERSRSEADMLMNKGKRSLTGSGDGDDEDEDMDTEINNSTYSVPLRMSMHNSSTGSSTGGSAHTENSTGSMSKDQPESITSSKDQDEPESYKPSRQPTIEEPPPSPTFAELFHSRDLTQERQTQVEEWIKQQAAALEIFRQSLIPLHQESNLLQVPNTLPPMAPQNSMDIHTLSSMHQASASNPHLALHQMLSPHPSQQSVAPGPIRPATLWRRSRSESDVSGHAFICEHCGQGFAMHDRLAKHIASRHRDRSASVNDENSRVHKCTLCPKSFGRSDMLTRHLRLHSGIKPYACHLCGQVFSRSDHLSTHQRTHTGEKPYRCPHCSYTASRRDMVTRHLRTHLLNPDGSPMPFSEIQGHELQIPIGQLSLSQPHTPEPQFGNNGSVSPLTARRHLSPVPTMADGRPPLPPMSTSLSPAVSALNLNNLVSGRKQFEGESSQATTDYRKPTLTVTPSTEASRLPEFPSPLRLKQMNAQMEVENSEAKMLNLNVASGSLTADVMLSTLGRSLDAQIPPSIRRSTPNLANLLGTGDHPSAFKPLNPANTNVQSNLQANPVSVTNSQPQTSDTLNFLGSLLPPAPSSLAGIGHMGQQSASSSSTLTFSSPLTGFNSSMNVMGGVGGGRISPSILRQKSIGGLGFSDNIPSILTSVQTASQQPTTTTSVSLDT